MKNFVTAAFALSLMASGAAMAQEHHEEHHEDHPGGGAPHPGGGAPHGPPPGAMHGPGPGQGPGQRPGPGPDQHVDRGRPGPGPQPNFEHGRPGSGPGPAPAFDRGRPGPGPGGPGFRPRPGGFLDTHHFSFNQRFHGPAFYYPQGYGYQRWAFGAFLPRVFLAQNYTLYQYWTYGLPAPPPGFHWIRVGPDALLVRYGDGYVLDAAYGLFY